MPIGSEKSDDAESDNRHEGAKSDHNQVERGHDAPNGRFYWPVESQFGVLADVVAGVDNWEN